MKSVNLNTVKERVKEAILDASFRIDGKLAGKIRDYRAQERSPSGQEILDQILQNADIAAADQLALCQDTGLAIFFVTLGEGVRLETDGFASLRDALTVATREAYQEGYLRKSVCDPLTRKNSGDNTPVFIHWEVVPGDACQITFMAKGGGSENMSALKMFSPSAGLPGIEDFIVDTISKAGPNPCPPTVVGVAIGGNFDTSAYLAKKALLRDPLGAPSDDPACAEVEKRVLTRLNKLGIGPMGYGGDTTVLALHVTTHPCHIASLPVAINVNCHSHRIRALEF